MLQYFFKELTRITFRVSCNILGRAAGYHRASLVPSLGTEVNYPVGSFYDVEVVLDDEHGIAALAKAGENFYEFVHIVRVQSRRGLVEDIERLARAAL